MGAGGGALPGLLLRGAVNASALTESTVTCGPPEAVPPVCLAVCRGLGQRHTPSSANSIGW